MSYSNTDLRRLAKEYKNERWPTYVAVGLVPLLPTIMYIATEKNIETNLEANEQSLLDAYEARIAQDLLDQYSVDIDSIMNHISNNSIPGLVKIEHGATLDLPKINTEIKEDFEAKVLAQNKWDANHQKISTVIVALAAIGLAVYKLKLLIKKKKTFKDALEQNGKNYNEHKHQYNL